MQLLLIVSINKKLKVKINFPQLRIHFSFISAGFTQRCFFLQHIWNCSALFVCLRSPQFTCGSECGNGYTEPPRDPHTLVILSFAAAWKKTNCVLWIYPFQVRFVSPVKGRITSSEINETYNVILSGLDKNM